MQFIYNAAVEPADSNAPGKPDTEKGDLERNRRRLARGILLLAFFFVLLLVFLVFLLPLCKFN